MNDVYAIQIRFFNGIYRISVVYLHAQKEKTNGPTYYRVPIIIVIIITITIAIVVANFDYLSEILILYIYDAWLHSTIYSFSKTLNEIEIFLRILNYLVGWKVS